MTNTPHGPQPNHEHHQKFEPPRAAPLPPKPDSFFKKQLKLASSTAVVTSVATFVIGFWTNLSIILLFIGIAIVGAAAFASSGGTSGDVVYGKEGASHKLLSLRLTGPIEGSSDDSGSGGIGSLFGAQSSVYGYDVKNRLLKAIDEKYDGIILEIDSPGGTIFGAKAISDGIEQYRAATKKPVYAHVQGLAASGAYWAAVETDKILADAGTGTGSIGVIYGPFTYYNNPTAVDGGLLGGGVVTQGGIEETYITAGEGKDAGNPYRRLTDKEVAVLQESVNDNYEQFVKHVAERRGISESTIRDSIGAHLYGEDGALKRKLIDGVASREQAYNQLAEAAHLKWGEYEVVRDAPSASNPWDSFSAKFLGGKPAASAQTSASSALPGVCSSVSTPLAYHGDLMQLCKAK